MFGKGFVIVFATLSTAIRAAAGLQEQRFVPVPKSLTIDMGRQVRLADATPVSVFCANTGESAAAEEYVRAKMRDWFGAQPAVTRGAAETFASPEGYRLSADESGVRITAAGLAGVRHAMSTLRQAADPVRTTTRPSQTLSRGSATFSRNAVAGR